MSKKLINLHKEFKSYKKSIDKSRRIIKDSMRKKAGELLEKTLYQKLEWESQAEYRAITELNKYYNCIISKEGNKVKMSIICYPNGTPTVVASYTERWFKGNLTKILLILEQRKTFEKVHQLNNIV